MHAVIFRTHGGPETLEYTEVPTPSPGPGEVLIRVKACSINHLDLWNRQGIPAYRIQLPHISGCDVAGVVEKVGPEVQGLPATMTAGPAGVRVGDRVFIAPGQSCFACEWCQAGQDNRCSSFGVFGAKTPGGYAELTVARASDLIPIPEGVTFEEAAAFPLVFLTAWHMLITRAGLRPGETVLIHAA